MFLDEMEYIYNSFYKTCTWMQRLIIVTTNTYTRPKDKRRNENQNIFLRNEIYLRLFLYNVYLDTKINFSNRKKTFKYLKNIYKTYK